MSSPRLEVMIGPGGIISVTFDCNPAAELTGCDLNTGNCTGYTPDPNPDPFETTSVIACTPAPSMSCLAIGKGFLLVKPDKLIAKFLKGPLLAQTDFGNPLNINGTSYDLCIYDDVAANVGSLSVSRAGEMTCDGEACWKAAGGDPPDGKGYKYKDPLLAASSVKQILLKGGEAGKSKALVKAFPAAPTGIPAGLQSSANATIQLRGSDAPQCLTATLTDIKTNDGTTFKAK